MNVAHLGEDCILSLFSILLIIFIYRAPVAVTKYDNLQYINDTVSAPFFNFTATLPSYPSFTGEADLKVAICVMLAQTLDYVLCIGAR